MDDAWQVTRPVLFEENRYDGVVTTEAITVGCLEGE